MKKKKLFVVDISSFIFRAFFAIRPLNAPDGTPVNAVHGVLSMLLKLLSKYQPTHVVMARDLKGGSFRNQMYSEYKANRSEPPEDLVPQFALIDQLLDEMKFKSCSVINYEADDVIGSCVTQWKEEFEEIAIVSSDKDLMQYIGDNIKMLDTMKDIYYGRDEVFTKMGVYPEQIVDYLSLLGDASDNIPGMKGVGAKGASKLLGEYQTLENCVANVEKLTNKRVVNAFANHLEDAYLSKKLIQIVSDLDLRLAPEDCSYKFDASEGLVDFLTNLGFKSMVKKIQDMNYNEQVSEDIVQEPSFQVNRDSLFIGCTNNFLETKDIEEFLIQLKNWKNITYYIDYIEAEPVAISLSGNGEESFTTIVEKEVADLVREKIGISKEQFVLILKAIWGNSEVTVNSITLQDDFLILKKMGVNFNAKCFSISQGAFIAEPVGKNDLLSLGMKYFDETLTALDKGAELVTSEKEFVSSYMGERAILSYKLVDLIQKDLKQKDLDSIYNDIDGPLLNVLAEIERVGMLINIPYLYELEEKFQKELDEIEKKIRTVAGEEINLRSPKQVGVLLFDILNLPVVKKTKTGYSTDVEVLTTLSSEHEIPRELLRYRELDKLLSTYVKVLPRIVADDGRVHTHFNQNVAATGRLSSVNPNLQNIPVRSDSGKYIRKAFVANPGKVLLSADYSQVELRLLAHFSEDETMINAFNNNEDIHAQTAAEILQVPLDQVTSSQRSQAKAVNFGLMYGQSSFGLASSLGISRKEAKEYITHYFERFSKVKAYLDKLKESCAEKGYVETYYGRKRFLPDINSKNRTVKAVAERVAINSPIQGTAADIIKKAMIEIYNYMTDKKMKSQMILQVHDELIFEVVEEELSEMKSLIEDKMMNVCKLSIPLSVDMGMGVNWMDLKS